MPGGTRNRAMTEHDLAEHVRKAVNPVETAPKQKHVRSCIVYSWDHQSSKAVWNALKGQPVLSDQIPCFKALITIHKLLVGGPHIVLGEGLGEVRFLDDCARMQGSANLGFGYAPLIRAYVDYLKAKLEFHRVHPQFTGNFDYEEYLSLRGVADLNEGYQTIMELIDLQAKLESFAKLVLGSTHGNNECRIASLVPLIEESHGLYKFLTSMLSAMHLSVESADPLVPLVERYNALFWDLKKFYLESSRLPYLTSLTQIPELPAEPPSFADIVVTRAIPKPEPVREEPKPVEPEPSIASVSSADLLGDALLETKEPSATEQLKGLHYGSHVNTVQTIAVPVYDENLQRAYQELLAENAELRAQLQAAASHIASLEEMIRQDQTIRTELQRQLDLKELRHQEQLRALEDHLKAVRTEAETWKARSDAMGNLYQKLREEHLQLLTGKKDDGEEERLRKEAEEAERLRREEAERLRLEEEEQERLRLARLEEMRLAQLEEEERLRMERLSASDELERLAEAVEAAANKFNLVASDLDSHLAAFPQNVHEAILGGTQAMTGAIGNLIRQAIAAQKEIMAEGREGLSVEDFYRKNSQWANGLVSAAQAVATSTVLLVETANGALMGTHTLEQLVVASNNVAAATTQLVTASRVKAVKRSLAQPKLEEAARAVSEANRKLVAASAIHADETGEEVQLDIKTMPGFTVLELNKNSELQLAEKKLELARLELADHRRRKYAADASEEAGSGIDIEEMNKQVEIKELERKLASLRIEYDMIQLKKPLVKEEKDRHEVVGQSQADNLNDHEQLLL